MTFHDITLLLVSDGEEWGKYVASQLTKSPQVRHQTIVMDDLLYENPPEVTMACKESAVVLLLVTPELLVFLETKTGWFSRVLREVPDSSSIVLFLLLDKDDSDRLYDLAKESYVSDSWTFFDPGYQVREVRQTIAKVLDMVEKYQLGKVRGKDKEAGATDTACGAIQEKREEVRYTDFETVSQEKKLTAVAEVEEGVASKKKTPPPTQKKPSNVVQFFPSVIHESGVHVAMVFKDEVRGNITLKVEQTDIHLTPKRENEKVFTFSAPELAPGKHNVLILEGDKRRGQSSLTVRGAEMGTFCSPHYLCQILRMPDLHHLDVHLKEVFSASLPPAGSGLETVFHYLTLSDQTEQQKHSEALYPTLLHYAAAHGMSEFCAALLECPGRSLAYHIRNCDGLDPAELAAKEGFEELENYIIDFMEMQTANEIYDHYIAMHQFPAPDSDQDEYEDMSQILAPPARSRAQSEPAATVTTSSPTWPQPWSSQAGRGQTNSQDPEYTCAPDRPPLPPPRQKACAGSGRSLSERRPNSPYTLQAISEMEQKTSTLPALGTGMGPVEFMGMGASDAFQLQLSKGAMGSRSQDELIQMNEMVKAKEISLREAGMLFNAWQQRYGKTPSSSFKDRQKELTDMKTEYQKVREALKKEDKTSKGLFQRMGFGGRQSKPTVKLNVSEPVVQRQQKKRPKVFTKSASASQLLPCASDRASSASTASSSSSSRDSGWSQGSRDSRMSSTYECDSEKEEDFEPRSSMRRSSTARDSTKRTSLGHQYLQLTEEETEKQDSSAPALPPRSDRPPLPLPTSTSGSAAHPTHP